jgi:hypothetical protein
MSKSKIIISTLSGLVTAVTAFIVTYFFAIRPWHLRWGSTDEEVDMKLPGDDLIPNAKLKATHAITINAKQENIWPWLVQIGQGRGGFYSYDWIENTMGLNIHTAEKVLPEYQELKVGDLIPLSKDGFGFPVAILESPKSMVLHGDTRLPGPGNAPVMKPGDYMAAVWGFHLVPKANGHTRLVERIFIDWNENPFNTVFYRVFLEPGSFIMEQKMLKGIKDRVENFSS